MSDADWQLLFVDDDPQVCEEIQEALNDEIIDESKRCLHIETFTEFNEALDSLETRRYDLIILDVRLGAEEVADVEQEIGVITLKEIKQRRFVPIIFFTNLPGHVSHLATSKTIFIQVVEKTKGILSLREAISKVFSAFLPQINRALIRHVESVQREYMWTFVAENWEEIQGISDRTALAYLLSRRLALSLSGPEIVQFSRDLGDESPQWVGGSSKQIHPMLYYLMPAIKGKQLTGDIYHGELEGIKGYWICTCLVVDGR